jgi:hypothetical protein
MRNVIDEERDAYALRNAPHILAALIIRRNGTNPDELVDKALSAVRKIYNRVTNSPDETSIEEDEEE